MMRTVTTIGSSRFRRRLMVYHSSKLGWCLAWANPTEHGHKYEKPMRTGISTGTEARRIAKLIRSGAT